MSEPETAPKSTGPWQPRFGIATMLLVMLLVSVVAAGANYLVQALRGGRQFQLAFILFTVAGPLLLVVIVSLARAAFSRIR